MFLLQFLNFHSVPSSVMTLSMTLSWNYIWEIFHRCLLIEDITDSLVYVLWMTTVVTFVPKLITAIVVTTFEASDRERSEFVMSRQY